MGGCGAAGSEGDDPIGHAGCQQRRAQIDHPVRLPFAHWQEPQAVLAESAKLRANAVELREVVLAHGQQDFEQCGFEAEIPGALGIVAQGFGGAVFHEIGEFGDELRGSPRPHGRFAAKREGFFKLVKDEEGSDEFVAGAPEVVAFAVEVFPKRLVLTGLRCFHPSRAGSRGDGAQHLRRERRRAF